MFIFFHGSSLIALNFPLPQKASLCSFPPSPARPDCPQHRNTAPARGGMGLPLPGLSPSLFSQTGRKSCDFFFFFFSRDWTWGDVVPPPAPFCSPPHAHPQEPAAGCLLKCCNAQGLVGDIELFTMQWNALVPHFLTLCPEQFFSRMHACTRVPSLTQHFFNRCFPDRWHFLKHPVKCFLHLPSLYCSRWSTLLPKPPAKGHGLVLNADPLGSTAGHLPINLGSSSAAGSVLICVSPFCTHSASTGLLMGCRVRDLLRLDRKHWWGARSQLCSSACHPTSRLVPFCSPCSGLFKETENGYG